MRKLLLLLPFFLILQVGCLLPDFDDTDTVTKEQRDRIEKHKRDCDCIELPSVRLDNRQSNVMQVDQDETEKNRLDRFPFGPKEPTEPESDIDEITKEYLEAEKVLNGEIWRELQDAIRRIIRSTSRIITIGIYFIPIGIFGYFSGFILAGIASIIYGAALVKQAIRKFRSAPKK